MNSKSKIKNIFINFVLVCSMVLSVIGSAFLLKPVINSSAEEGSVINGLPNSLKFTSAKTQSDAIDYNSTDGYIYSGSSLNYVNANALTYYFDQSNGLIYADPEYKIIAKDIKFSYKVSGVDYYYNPEDGKLYTTQNFTTGTDVVLSNPSPENSEIKITKANETTYSTYTIYSDIYTFLYKNARYYFKNGSVFSDAKCTTEVSAQIPYVVQFSITVNTIDRATIQATDPSFEGANLAAGTYYSEIAPLTFYEIAGYYSVSDTSGVETGYYIKADDYNNLYYDSSSGIKKYNLLPSTTFERIRPHTIYFRDNSISANSLDTINQHVNIDSYNWKNEKISTKYYTFENKIYPYPVLREFVSSNNIEYSYNTQNPSTIIIYSADGTKTQKLTYYPISIDGITHYVLYSTALYTGSKGSEVEGTPSIESEIKLYDYNPAIGALPAPTTSPMVEITKTTALQTTMENNDKDLQQTIPYEYIIKSIDRTTSKVIISRLDADNDNIDEKRYETGNGLIKVNYYFTNETKNNIDGTPCNIVVINGKKYAMIKPAIDAVNPSTQLFDVSSGAEIKQHSLDILSVDHEKVVVAYANGSAANPTRFVRYGVQYLYNAGVIREIGVAPSTRTFVEVYIESQTYYIERTGASPYTYETIPYLLDDNDTANTDDDTMTPSNEINIISANEHGIEVSEKEYYYVGNKLCIKGSNIQTIKANINTDSYINDASQGKSYPIVIMGETYYLRVLPDGTLQTSNLYVNPATGTTKKKVENYWELVSISPIRDGSPEVLIKINYSSPHIKNDTLGDEIYTIKTAMDLEVNIELVGYKKITGSPFLLYPVSIQGKIFYIPINANTNAVAYTTNLITNLSYPFTTTNTPNGCKLIGVEKVGNIITVKLNGNIDYAINNNNAPFKYDSSTLNNCTNFVSYNAKYFYFDTKLYLDDDHLLEISDFSYDANTSQVLINNAYIQIESAYYEYVELYGKVYYYDGSELYTSITLGDDNLIKYSDKVIDSQFGYKINPEISSITIFDNGSSTELIDETIVNAMSGSQKNELKATLDGADAVGVVTEEGTGTEYYVANNDHLYLKSAATPDTGTPAKVDYSWININYTLSFTNDTLEELINTDFDLNGKLDDALTINGIRYTLQNPGNTNSYSFSKDGNAPYYIIFKTNKDTLKELYFTTLDTLTRTDTEPKEGADFKVAGTSTTEGATVTVNAYRDFIPNRTDGTVLFAKSTQDAYMSYTGTTFTYLNRDYTITGSKLTRDLNPGTAEDIIDATEEIFDYQTPQNVGDEDSNKTLTALKFNGTKFVTHQSQIVGQEFEYVQSGGMYYIVGKYGSNNAEIFTSIVNYPTTNTLNPYTGTAEIMSVSIKFSDQEKSNPVESSISKIYQSHESINEDSRFDNGNVVFLDNFITQQKFFNQTAAASEKIKNVYIGFNEKLTSIDVPTDITRGVTSLTVTGYLKNDFVMKYFSTTEGFNTEYGIGININDPVQERVFYLGQATEGINMYWFQHLDLSGLKANIDYGDGELLTEIISETSGLYTFIFDFTYLESQSAAAVSTQTYHYVFSFYLTESSDYVEYPTFNTYLTNNNNPVSNPNDEPTDVSVSEYSTVVSNTTKTANQSNITYTYNNQTFDKPIYIFNATKYNVSYDFKYNLENHSYKTSFVIKNAGKSTEYGLLSIFKDTNIASAPYKYYRMDARKFNNGVVVDYYTSESIDPNRPYENLYGSLYIDASGDYYLSLEDYYYYNSANRSAYGSELSYYENGRLIKNGPQNAPKGYYFALLLTDLGDYTFTNKYMISKGNDGNSDTSYFEVLEDVSVDTLKGLYNIYKKDGASYEKIDDLYLEGQEITRFAYFNASGEFILPSNIIQDTPDSDPNYYISSTKSSNPTLKIYGINTTFNKNNNEIPFNKLDENVYSDITPDTNFKNKDGNNINFVNDLIDVKYGGVLKFDETYTVPITNLQPVYFRYYGTFNYNESYYYRYQDCSYVINENGTLSEVDFSQSTRTKVGFTNKTSISSSGFYIVVVNYNAEQIPGLVQTQYFMFAVDNSAPNLELYVANESNASDKTLFISSTTFSQTSRYTNKDYIIPSWLNPNYFQGDIVVTYKHQNYGVTTTISQGTCTNNLPIKTGNGRFTFTINYGVNGISSTSTYIIVDQVTPEGKLYSSSSDIDLNYFISQQYDKNVFNEPVTFASSPFKTDSGAQVTARMTTISLQSYSDFGEIIPITSLNAITTNVELDATSSSFNNTLDESPIYNFFDIHNAVKDHEIKKSQLLGLSDESTVYIIKLFDEAGNYSIYYYLFDNSTPYLKYQLLENAGTQDYVDSFEDNTTNTNTSIVWNHYKAIHVKTDGSTRELFENLKTQVSTNSATYGQISFEESHGELYLIVPIQQVSLESKIMVDGLSSKYTAKTSKPNFSPSSTVFIDTAKDESMTGFNTSFSISPSLDTKDFFRGNRDYQIKVTDNIGNTLSKKLWVNGSFAQEKFEGIRENSSTKYRLSEDTAYNIGQITTTYKALTDQSFYAQISYDYYGIDFENYLTNNEGFTPDSNHISYSTFGYDLYNSVIYMYDVASNKFVERGEKQADGTYAPAHDYAINPEKFYTFEELNSSTGVAKGKFYLPGYPFVLSTTNSIVSTTETTKNGTAYKESGAIYEENQLSKQGLYVFRRVYIDNITSKEITQSDIEQAGSSYEVLKNDRAVRYYVYYVDRNNIINLVYDANGNINPIESIGNLLEMFLGTNIEGIKDPVINAETLNSGGSTLDVSTNKLKVETNFSADKYATVNKLMSLRNYSYSSGSINQIGEDLSIKRNNNTFNFLVNLSVQIDGVGGGNFKVINDNVINPERADLAKAISKTLTNEGNVQTNMGNYQFVTSGDYTLTISDNTYVLDNDTGEKIDNSANSLVFKFGIAHYSPQGGFITLLDSGVSIKEMTIREHSLSSNGHTYVYNSSNVNNLSFTFSDSESNYEATVNPYNVTIQKAMYSNGSYVSPSTIFQSNKTNTLDGYWRTFSQSTINADESGLFANPQNPNRIDILEIYDCDGNNIQSTGQDNGAPYTYRINIFDKEKSTLITDYSQDAVYIVTINYIGTESDYIVDSSNFFKSIYIIHIDRVAPQENLKKLISSDPNLDEFCIEKYGLGYTYLTDQQKQEIIETYAFPVNYIEGSIRDPKNIAYYYAKDNYGSIFSNIDDSYKPTARYEVLNNYSTYFNHNYDDSNKIYARSIGNNIKEYKFSILPHQEGYDKVEQYQDHQRFTPSSTAYNKFDYVNGKFYFSDNLVDSPTSNLKFDNAYYEIIEEDEAGNLSRYLVYASDNTNVSVDYRYITSDDDNTDKNYDGVYDNSSKLIYEGTEYFITDRKYFIYNNTKYYAIIFPSTEPETPDNPYYAVVGTIDNNVFERKIETDDGLEISTVVYAKDVFNNDVVDNYKYYYHNNTIEKSIEYVKIGNQRIDLVGNQFVNIDYTNNDPLEILNISGIHFVSPAADNDTYLFDNFFTVKIYQGAYSPTAVPVETFISNPYAESFSVDSFMNNITANFKKLIAETEGVYEYSISITNRFNKDHPYIVSFNLPDQVLELDFGEPEENTLTVTLPDSSNYVKILEFSVYRYEDKQWKEVTTDLNGIVIQRQNQVDYNAGLSSITYTFGEGQYKFITHDNYGRMNGNGNFEYRIVGGSYDEHYDFTYNQPHIIDQNGQIITSGYASLNIDDNIYQVNVILKNAVKILYADGTTDYFALISDGTTTKMYRYVNGISDQIIYLTSEGKLVDSSGFEPGCKEIYYNRGKLYTDTNYQSAITITGAEYVVYPATSNQHLYSLGARIENKRSYTFLHVCENQIAEYQIRINWATDPSNYSWTNIKFDRNAPVITLLLNEGGIISAVENQNYNKPFTISWTSNYNTTATLVRTTDSQSTIIHLTPGESYEINMIAGYTLTIIDEIGNKYTFNFNYVKKANDYFSVLIDELEILPSEYVVPDEASGKTIRYYYYKKNPDKPNVISIKTDETKNISYIPVSSDTFTIIRTNIGNYPICHVKVVEVVETSAIKDFLASLQFNMKDGSISNHSTTDNKNPFVYVYNKGQDCESFTLTVNKNLAGNNQAMIGNKIYVRHFYNEKLVRTYSSDSWSQINGSSLKNFTFPITISSTGVHRFEFRDSVGNKALQDVEITLIKDIMFTANEENPIDYRFFNSDVVIDIPNTSYYSEVAVTAKLNGVEINTAEFRKGSKYTFSQAGSYEVYMTAESIDENYQSTGTYNSVYYFTIINPNVTKMTFGFSNNYGFTISKVLKNQADITDLIKSEGVDNMWLTSGNPDSVGTYTITLLGYDKLANSYLPFTFSVKLNNEIPTIMGVDYAFGTKTTKSITIQYNAAVIYSQVGESYISIIGDNGTDARFDINADSLDELATITISNNGKYRITIYNKDGIFIASYSVHKAAPLNTSAKIIIAIAVILVVGLTVVFIVLRRHTKFR